MAKATEVTTNEVRISYEHLLKPYAQDPKAEPKYSATLLIPKTDVATKQRIDAAIQAAVTEGISNKWGGVRPPQIPVPLHDGDGVRPNGEPFGPECRGHWVMTASSKLPPEIVDASLNPVIQPTEIYSGMYARVNINFFAYFNTGKKGIGCGLGPVQKTRDGEPLGGRVSAAEAFGASAGATVPCAAAPVYQPPTQAAPQPQYQAYDPITGMPAQPQQQFDPITGQPIQPPVMGL